MKEIDRAKMISFQINKIMVMLTDAADKIFIFTNFPCPFVEEYIPGQPPLNLTFDASYDKGVEYVRHHFHMEPEVVNIRHVKKPKKLP